MSQNAWSSVRAICFDLDGTLYNQTSLRIRMSHLLLREWVAGRIQTRHLKILRSYRKNRELARQLGVTPGLDAHILAATAGENKCSVKEVAETVERWICQAPLPILAAIADPRLRQMLQRLCLRGYGLGIFSDYPVRSKLKALGFPPGLFEAIVEAGEPEVSALKPHPKGFLEVCRRLNVPPREVLYVGDRMSVDGVGARSAGMQFVLYEPYSFVSRGSESLGNLLQLERRLGACRTTEYSRRLEGCWLCGGSSSVECSPSKIPKNPTPDLVKITDSHYGHTARLLRCTACAFIRADTESARALESLYQRLVDDEYQESSMARRKTFAGLLNLIRDLRPGAFSLLDIGASTGVFCAEAGQAGFCPEGVEPSAWAVAEGRRNGLKLHEGYFPHPDLRGRQFDIITLCDVIEHVSEPVELLQAARRCLSPKGLLVVVTPDISSLAARVMGPRWWHLRPAHIGYFSRQTMQAALGAAGFTLEHLEPYTWWFPLGYVVKRLGAYFPIGPVTRFLAAQRRLAPIWQASVPVGLRDSHIYFARPTEV